MLSTEVTRFAIHCQIRTFGVFWGKSVELEDSLLKFLYSEILSGESLVKKIDSLRNIFEF